MSRYAIEPFIEDEEPCKMDFPEISDEIDKNTNEYREAARHFISELDRILSFIIESENKTLAAICLAHAFGRTGITGGKSQADIAPTLGVTRAAVTKCVKQIQARFGNAAVGIEPMPGQRTIKSCNKFSKARKAKCK